MQQGFFIVDGKGRQRVGLGWLRKPRSTAELSYLCFDFSSLNGQEVSVIPSGKKKGSLRSLVSQN